MIAEAAIAHNKLNLKYFVADYFKFRYETPNRVMLKEVIKHIKRLKNDIRENELDIKLRDAEFNKEYFKETRERWGLTA